MSIKIEPQLGPVQIGVSWDIMNDKQVDLDATIIMANECGMTVDAVYYNKLISDCGAINHSGDSKDGKKEGFDEVITIDFSKLNYSVSYLAIMINSFKGDGFSMVETATVTISQGAQQLGMAYLGSGGSNCAAVLGVFYRTNPTWSFQNTTLYGVGIMFTECDDLIQQSLQQAGLDPILMEETKNWTPASKKKFNMKKDSSVNLPFALQNFRIGLGWDSEMDIDCSVLQFDKNGHKQEIVYYGNLSNHDETVVHSGDNTTGEGAGDDEIISVNLSNMSQTCDSVWVVITIYDYGKEFDDVKGAYCRIYNRISKQEFVRYDLSANKDNISNGNIVGNFKRSGSGWTFCARGYYTKRTRTAEEILPLIRQVMNNNLENVKIDLNKPYKDEKKRPRPISNNNDENEACCGCTIF